MNGKREGNGAKQKGGMGKLSSKHVIAKGIDAPNLSISGAV